MAVDPELLIHSDLKSRNFAAFISLVIRVNFSGAVGVLSTLAGTILIERDWIQLENQMVERWGEYRARSNQLWS
ncbi:hypothetical protein SAY87_031815 [Trapa incisa]|uniref:Solute carrier family 40 member n=1 Tax=Trapa incisa TaxID=236973 RepID=A0AAN7KL70_9MYRT|nr:hypothetical protein SAY87_031815 [Trapa incisa]